MSRLKILIYEDEPNAAAIWEDKIGQVYVDADAGVDVRAAQQHEFEPLLRLVNNRRNKWRPKGDYTGSFDDRQEVDEADVVIVDYDLLKYAPAADTTGSRLAYLLRCFTECGFIIVLNEYGPNVFDLSLGNPSEHFADMHIGGEQIGNPGLWMTPFRGYRPWYWPVVPNAVENFKKCVDEVEANLDRPIFEHLGLDCVIDWIPRRARDFLSGNERMEHMTFRGFVENTRAGIDAKDNLIPKQIARVAAARVGTLLNSIILPEQNALVDAPHLVSRFPSLIRGEGGDMETWNRLCSALGQEAHDLLDGRLEEYRFEMEHWLWRPAWYWPKINRDERFLEVKEPWMTGDANPNWEFCEEISRFVPTELTQDFRALVSPPYMKRFVLNQRLPGAVDIVPELGSGGTLDPSTATFVPESMFSY